MQAFIDMAFAMRVVVQVWFVIRRLVRIS